MTFKKFFCFSFAIFCMNCIFSQEALKSIEEEYYDFLSLQGITERPTLGYRTLSDSVWTLDENTEHLWQDNNLGTTFTLWQKQEQNQNWFLKGLNQNIKVRIYGPEWYNSYNTAAPYGQNDGALWQGKGYNTSLTAGARLEAFGFELTLKPQVTFSQNLEFETMPSSYDSEYGYFWGYGKNIGIDAPQRFGDKAFWTFDWGDSELRWSWHTFTMGFGTQSIWLGPAYLNPILHSNNAATYPKFDLGLRKTSLYMPHFGWHLGDIEGRIWIGYLSESDYFDNDDSNNHNQISGFTLSYNPPFIKGFTIGANKICLSKWGENFWKYLNPFYNENPVGSEVSGEDQKISVNINYFIEKAKLELYSEFALDDYFQGGWIIGLLRYPYDSLIWTMGLKQVHEFNSKVKGEFILEFSNMELPRNKLATKMGYSFDMHYQIEQGFTNKGQAIGTLLAMGGNSQLLKYKLYYPKGCGEIFIQRENPNNTYSYINLKNENQTYKSYFNIGISNSYYVLKNLCLSGGFVYNLIINPYYYRLSEDNTILDTGYLNNFVFSLSAKYSL